MPSLPIQLPFAVLPSGEDLPVKSTADVLAQYPEHVASVEEAPVRDAVVEAETELFLAYQGAASYAAAQSDPTRATGIYLEQFLDEVGLHRGENETDDSARARLFGVPEVVTPKAILDVVNALLAPVRTGLAQLSDSILDRWYVQRTKGDDPDLTWDDASASWKPAAWHTFVADGLHEMDPDYPDRRYALRRQPLPGGPRLFGDGHGRFFVLRVPDLSGSDDNAAFVADGSSDIVALYMFDGAQAITDGAFVATGVNAADALYQEIADQVNAIRGQGVRWLMIVDPRCN